MTWGRRWSNVRAVFAQRDKRRLLSCAAVMIAANWGIYIWAVNTETEYHETKEKTE